VDFVVYYLALITIKPTTKCTKRASCQHQAWLFRDFHGLRCLLSCVDYHKTNNEMHEKSFMLSSGLAVSYIPWIIISSKAGHSFNQAARQVDSIKPGSSWQ